MENMFCFQCEQTASHKACTAHMGVCGKKSATALLQDRLTGALIALANATHLTINPEITQLFIDGLFMTLTNVNFDDEALNAQYQMTMAHLQKTSNPTPYNMQSIWHAENNIRSLKSLLLFGLRGMAAYAYHARILNTHDETVDAFFYKGLALLGKEDISTDILLSTIMEFGHVNLKCMALLDKANTSTFGVPQPTAVSLDIETGPFIVVTGHDFHDLLLLLEQTKDKGIHIYTHGEMLPAHAYPKLKAYPHLKGHFGSAWQNQQKEFDNLPGAVLFTTNCLMPPKDNYKDHIFTTDVVGYPGVYHIDKYKDFTPIIEKALDLGGFDSIQHRTGANGGHTLWTGFAHNSFLEHSVSILKAINTKQLSHIFLVGGCDGACTGRSYFTDFVKATPQDSIVLTLACGKFRFNDLDLGHIGNLPRLMDIGQCNDAYSAIIIASALADALKCDINDLPLSLILSWYEQKAVAILLTLLSLGLKNIYLGPTLPAFISSDVLSLLVEQFGLKATSNAHDDLKAILS